MKDACTLGDSNAALILVELIKEHPESKKISRKVSRTMVQYNTHASCIEDTLGMWEAELPTAIKLYRLLVDDAKKKCALIFCNEEDVKICTFTQNLIETRFKSWMGYKEETE